MLRTTLLLNLTILSLAIADPKAKFEVENNALKVPSPVVYETGKDTLKPESAAAINHVAAYLENKSAISTLRIEVHSDSTGTDEFNLKMSAKRAFAVGKALIAKGVDCKRLVAVGFGETKPIADNDTPEGKAKNRRTEFINAALRGHAIGGMPIDGGGTSAGDLCVK